MRAAARFFSVRTDDEIETAYRHFLRKTWLTPFALVTWACEAVTKTGYFLDDDLILNRHLALAHVIENVLFYVWPLLFILLIFTLGRKELHAVAFGKLKNIWCVLLVAVPLGALGHYSIDLCIALGGGRIQPISDLTDLVSRIVFLLFIALLVSIQEETWFRLVLQTYLQRFGTWSGVALTAVLFALFHISFFDRPPTPNDSLQVLALLPSALLLCLSRRYFGSMLVVVVMHVTTNTLAK